METASRLIPLSQHKEGMPFRLCGSKTGKVVPGADRPCWRTRIGRPNEPGIIVPLEIHQHLDGSPWTGGKIMKGVRYDRGRSGISALPYQTPFRISTFIWGFFGLHWPYPTRSARWQIIAHTKCLLPLRRGHPWTLFPETPFPDTAWWVLVFEVDDAVFSTVEGT